MDDIENRRPLELRDWDILQKSAAWLSQTNITPNQISFASVAFSALAGFFLLLFSTAEAALWFYTLLALLCFLGRGLCNVLDGLVAVEGGKSTASGELFNDIPDRISDIFIFVCAGYAAGMPALGWIAAIMAVLTAYTRTLAKSLGAPSDFQGPMAKTHRMAVIAIACFLTPIEAFVWETGPVFILALGLISAGCGWTIWNRAQAAYFHLEDYQQDD